MHQIIEGSITTSGTQDYEGAITLTDNTTLVSGDQITFDTTVNSEGSETNNLTVTATELQVDGIIGGTQTLGAISITGILDLNAAITNATSLSVSCTSNLGANVTTSSTQTYSDDITISADISLNTSGGDVTFDGIIITDSSSSEVYEVIQFLGNGNYKYSDDGGSTYSSLTATSTATDVGDGTISFASDTYTWNYSDDNTIETLLVGGGGSGGPDLGGGGGGGGVISIPSLSISADTDYSIVVGDGGVSTGCCRWSR